MTTTTKPGPMRLWWIPSCGLSHLDPFWQLCAVVFVLALVVLTRRAR